jgi:hypothetical protein
MPVEVSQAPFLVDGSNSNSKRSRSGLATRCRRCRARVGQGRSPSTTGRRVHSRHRGRHIHADFTPAIRAADLLGLDLTGTTESVMR